jgi:hypothetical protein
MAKRKKAESSRKPAVQPPAAPRPLTDAQRAELLTWGEHIARQPHPPCFDDGKGALTYTDGIDPDLHFARIVAAFGSANSHAINILSCPQYGFYTAEAIRERRLLNLLIRRSRATLEQLKS